MVELTTEELQPVLDAVSYFLNSRRGTKRWKPQAQARDTHLVLVRERLREALATPNRGADPLNSTAQAESSFALAEALQAQGIKLEVT